MLTKGFSRLLVMEDNNQTFSSVSQFFSDCSGMLQSHRPPQMVLMDGQPVNVEDCGHMCHEGGLEKHPYPKRNSNSGQGQQRQKAPNNRITSSYRLEKSVRLKMP